MGKPREELDPATVTGVKYLRMVFRLFDRLAASGCERDRAHNRELFFNQYAGLVLLSFFNPTLQTVDGLSDLSALKKVQKLLGGSRASPGSLSESVRVFEPELLAKIFEELLESVPKESLGRSFGSIPQELVQKLTAVDGSAFRALPSLRQTSEWLCRTSGNSRRIRHRFSMTWMIALLFDAAAIVM